MSKMPARFPQFNLPPYFSAKEHDSWTTIWDKTKSDSYAVARVVWGKGIMLSSIKGEQKAPVILTYDKRGIRAQEIPFDTPEAAVRYVETMCALNAWEN